MGATQVKIGNAVLQSLVDMKQKSGEIRIEDVGSMFQNIASSLHIDSADGQILRREIEKISEYIENAKKEIGGIVVEGEDGTSSISSAGMELNEVVKHTEEATNKILDAMDIVSEHTANISDEATATAITDATMAVYDACNFQDITGQRISKVISVIEYVEHRMNRIASLIDGALDSSSDEIDVDDKFIDKRPDADLCNGPQSSKDAPNQDDIDALFDSL